MLINSSKARVWSLTAGFPDGPCSGIMNVLCNQVALWSMRRVRRGEIQRSFVRAYFGDTRPALRECFSPHSGKFRGVAIEGSWRIFRRPQAGSWPPCFRRHCRSVDPQSNPRLRRLGFLPGARRDVTPKVAPPEVWHAHSCAAAAAGLGHRRRAGGVLRRSLGRARAAWSHTFCVGCAWGGPTGRLTAVHGRRAGVRSGGVVRSVWAGRGASSGSDFLANTSGSNMLARGG